MEKLFIKLYDWMDIYPNRKLTRKAASDEMPWASKIAQVKDCDGNLEGYIGFESHDDYYMWEKYGVR